MHTCLKHNYIIYQHCINIGKSSIGSSSYKEATKHEPRRPPRLAPSQAENIVHFSKIKIAEEKNVVEIKTVDSMNAKNANIDVIKNVMNDRECQGISENGQSEVGSVSCEVMKSAEQNAKNDLSGLKELNTESLDTSIRKKQPFKIFNITKTSSSKKIRVNSSRNILPVISTPTKRKLIEAKTVKNLISIIESSPAADPTGDGEGVLESLARWRKYNLIAEMNNHPN